MQGVDGLLVCWKYVIVLIVWLLDCFDFCLIVGGDSFVFGLFVWYCYEDGDTSVHILW